MTSSRLPLLAVIAAAAASPLADSNAQSGGAYRVDGATLSGGATSAAANGIDVGGTIAQPDVLRAAGGRYAVEGALWAVASAPPPETVFADGFEG